MTKKNEIHFLYKYFFFDNRKEIRNNGKRSDTMLMSAINNTDDNRSECFIVYFNSYAFSFHQNMLQEYCEVKRNEE